MTDKPKLYVNVCAKCGRQVYPHVDHNLGQRIYVYCDHGRTGPGRLDSVTWRKIEVVPVEDGDGL